MINSHTRIERKLSTSLVAGLLLSVFIGTGACSSTPPVTSGTGTETITQGDDFSKYLKVDNPALAKKLQISSVTSRITNDFMEVNVELNSFYKKSLKLQYHFNWFDTQGFVVESRKSPWKPLELHGQQSTTLRGVAPSSKATSFNVYTREVPVKAYKF